MLLVVALGLNLLITKFTLLKIPDILKRFLKYSLLLSLACSLSLGACKTTPKKKYQPKKGPMPCPMKDC